MPLLDAGLNAVTMSGLPFTTLPALATKMREEFPTSRIAAWVGLMPMRATPMLLSPATSICKTVPGLGATLVLIPKTAWEFAGFGGLLEIGITTGRYTSPQDIKISIATNIAANQPTRRRLIGTPREDYG